MESNKALITGLLDDLKARRLKLPVLPDVGLRILRALDNPSLSNDQLAKMVGADAALSARLMLTANSSLFGGRRPVEDVRGAVLRLGHTLIRNVLSAMLVEQLHQNRSARLKDRIKRLWRHHVHVAAISYALARRCTRLKPDEAMLAGLVHDIGTLPILDRAAEHPALLQDDAQLQRIITDFHGLLGKIILEVWRFPPELARVAAEHDNLDHPCGTEPSYLEVVIVANLHSYLGTDHPHTRRNWTEIPAFRSLGLTPEESIKALQEAREEIQEMQRLLGG